MPVVMVMTINADAGESTTWFSARANFHPGVVVLFVVTALADEERRIVSDLRMLLQKRGEHRIVGQVVGAIHQRGIDAQHVAHRRRMLVEDVVEPVARLPRVARFRMKRAWGRLRRGRWRLRPLWRGRGSRRALGRLARLGRPQPTSVRL